MIRTTRADLIEELEGLEQRRRALAQRLGARSESQLQTRPAPGAWSLLDVAEHLMLAERATLSWITERRAGRSLARRWYDPLLKRLIARTLDSSLRLPVAGAVITPRGQDSLPEVMRKWSEVRDAWRAYLAAMPGDGHDVLVFRHPIGVGMTAGETLVFLRRHFDHHLHQVRRIERATRLPVAPAER